MSHPLLAAATRTRLNTPVVARLLAVALLLALGALVAANLIFLLVHAAQVLRYPYPLDYGEGPLLAQVNLLRQGVSLRELYGPLDAPPHLVVNYPPVYLLFTLLVSFVTGEALLAGRLVSLVSALACVAALVFLTNDERRAATDFDVRLWSFALRPLVVLAVLALPIVREWAVLMRVDLLGVAFGLWGLVALRHDRLQIADCRLETKSAICNLQSAMLPALLLLASVFTKPSLIAAPVAALMYLLVRDWRRGLTFGALLVAGGLAIFGWLAYESHFFEHVVVANANGWERDLAEGFWRGQLAIHWPLFLAGLLCVLLASAGVNMKRDVLRSKNWSLSTQHTALILPLAYTLAGVVTAVGVGKVGAYLNYFLELYIGLLWLCALAITMYRPPFTVHRLAALLAPVLVIAALLRYYPTWSENYVKLAGVIEGENPPRMVVGRRGVWQDLRRERAILATLGRVNTTLAAEVRAAGGPIMTDIPGIAAQAGQVARLQAFEHSQVMQLWDQRDLRLDMANGRVPLVVLDYLGNWLSPEMIALITHRYAQDGSRGTYDLYRPVDPGAFRAVHHVFPDGINLNGYALAPFEGDRTQPGSLVDVTLEWRVEQPSPGDVPLDVVLVLIDARGAEVARSSRPLVYGALSPDQWPLHVAVQHMQPLELPADLPAGVYSLAAELRSGEQAAGSRVPLGDLEVKAVGGTLMANGWASEPATYMVPEPLLAAWRLRPLGLPLTPPVPFAGFTQQCFEQGCLRERAGVVEQAPVGEWLAAGDLGANGAFAQPAISVAFQGFYHDHGGEAQLGPAVTNEFRSGERMVQYTRYARLERPIDGGPASFGKIGEDYLRLPGGTPYRWP